MLDDGRSARLGTGLRPVVLVDPAAFTEQPAASD